jgi:polysaccharide export outer membrane protein
MMSVGRATLQAFAVIGIFVFLTIAGPALAQTGTLPGPSAASTARPVGAPPAQMVVPSPGQTSDTVATDEHYRLGTGDKIRVTVYGEDDLSGEFFVDSVGQIQLPLVGQVKAAGLTIHEFIGEIRTALQNGYLKDPKISVEVLNYRPFYILGEVNKPGEYPYENGLNVQSAIALAGGYTYRADDDEVYIRRNGSTREEAVPADATSKIRPGDIVRVAERIF